MIRRVHKPVGAIIVMLCIATRLAPAQEEGLRIIGPLDGNRTTAEDGPPQAPQNLPELIELATATNPILARRIAEVDQARGRQLQATLGPNPVVGYVAQEIGNEGQAGQHGLYWSRTWIGGNKLQLAERVVASEVQRRRIEVETERLRVANRVRQRYYELLAARRLVQLAEQFLRIANTNRDAVQTLFEAGEITRNQVLQAQIEQENAGLRLRNAETRLAAAESLLQIAVAVNELDASRVTGDLLAPAPELNLHQTIEWLMQESPELQSLDAEIRRARAGVESACEQPVPNVNTQLGMLYDDATHSAITNLQIGWQLPLRNQNTGNIQAAHAATRTAQQQRNELQLRLRDRAQQAFRDYQLARNRSQTYESSLLPLSRDNLKVTQASYRVGESSYQTLLTAQRSYFDTAIATVEARRLLWLSIARIQGLLVEPN